MTLQDSPKPSLNDVLIDQNGLGSMAAKVITSS